MKTTLYILTALLLASCSGKFSLQKRIYTKGFYFAHARKKADLIKKQEFADKTGLSKLRQADAAKIISAGDISVAPASRPKPVQNQLVAKRHFHNPAFKAENMVKDTYLAVPKNHVKKLGLSGDQNKRAIVLDDLLGTWQFYAGCLSIGSGFLLMAIGITTAEQFIIILACVVIIWGIALIIQALNPDRLFWYYW